MRARAQIGGYVLFVALIWAAVVFFRPEEARLPARAETPWPTVRVHGLEVPVAENGRPAFTAHLATPRSRGSVLTLGGFREGVDLEGVAVQLADGWLLEGERGRYVDSRLTLAGRVRIERGAHTCLEAARAEVWGDRIRFPGLVVLTGTGAHSTAVDLELPRAELLQRLHR